MYDALHFIILCPAAVLPRRKMDLLLIVWNIFSVYVNSRELCNYGISLFTCWPLIFLLYSSVAVAASCVLFNFKNIKCLHNILYFYVENMVGIGGKTETVFVLTHKSLEHWIDLSFQPMQLWIRNENGLEIGRSRMLHMLKPCSCVFWASYITFRSFSYFFI